MQSARTTGQLLRAALPLAAPSWQTIPTASIASLHCATWCILTRLEFPSSEPVSQRFQAFRLGTTAKLHSNSRFLRSIKRTSTFTRRTRRTPASTAIRTRSNRWRSFVKRLKSRAAPREVDLLFTRHGPVVYADPQQRRAFAVRSVWFEPGTSAYFGLTEFMTAKDWQSFRAAMARWGTPSENQVYADTAGNIR